MKRQVSTAVFILLVAGLVAVVVWGARPAPEPQASTPIRWQADFDKALMEARARNRIVMLDFYTDG